MAIMETGVAHAISSSSIQSKAPKVEKVKLVKNEDSEEPHYKLYPNVTTQIDEKGELSSITHRILLVCSIFSFTQYKIGEVKDYELQAKYDELCENEKLEEDRKHMETKGFEPLTIFL